ncbi:hypothetical protein BBM87_18460 [Vibrio parahaemolyticus]|nr:hypothetical protein BBM87_18460 [Vibrio parahaemolyticus]
MYGWWHFEHYCALYQKRSILGQREVFVLSREVFRTGLQNIFQRNILIGKQTEAYCQKGSAKNV